MSDRMGTEHIGPELNCVCHEIRRTLDLAIADVADPEVTGLRGRVLGYIVQCTERGADVYQRDIEAKFRIQRSSVTTLLQGMEAAGLIMREPVAEDARLKRLAATEKGLACNKRVRQVIQDFERELQSGVTEEEKTAMLSLLQKLSGNLKSIRMRYEK